MSAEVARLVADLMKDRPVGEPAEGLWDTVGELGLCGIGVPEDRGGSGGTVTDLATVVTEFAARGVVLPIVETAVARWALQADAGRREGTATVAVAAGASVSDGRVTATVRGVGWLREAAHVVLLIPGRDAPLVLDTADPGVRISPGTDLAGAPADELRATGVPAAEVEVEAEQVFARLALLRAAALVGAARGAYELTRSHLRTRNQFGKPLVALPMVATSLATMRVELLQAQTALAVALDGAESDAVGRALATATTARVVTASTATAIAGRAHQLHGAIGTTQEYALHRLTRLLWAGRDADLAEAHWAARLGERVLCGGEDHVWDALTAPVARVAS